MKIEICINVEIICTKSVVLRVVCPEFVPIGLEACYLLELLCLPCNGFTAWKQENSLKQFELGASLAPKL